MSHDLENFINTVRKPLFFASKNNFSNLDKIKNLESTVQDTTLKYLALNPPEKVRDLVIKLKNIFIEFEDSASDSKKNKIKQSFEIINQLGVLQGVSHTQPEFCEEHSDNEFPDFEIRYIRGVGPRISGMLNKRGIYTVEDLIFYSPRRYDDRRHITPLSDIVPGQKYTVMGRVHSAGEIRNKRIRIYKVIISDGSSILDLVWFNYRASYLRAIFKEGLKVVVNGEITQGSYKRNLQIIHPTPEDIEIIEDEDSLEESLQFNRIVPIYPLTEGLTQRRLRKLVREVLDGYLDKYESLISSKIIHNYSLINLKKALEEIHFPPENNFLVDIESSVSIYNSNAHRTVAFFEFFTLELALTYKQMDMKKKKGISFNTVSEVSSRLLKILPFKLTSSQLRVISEIDNDMKSPYPMNRLLQGDVGSGKTVVALISILKAIGSGYQAVFMVPTEILAEQHFQNINNLLKSININTGLLKSALSKKEKSNICNRVKNGTLDLVIGTHALIQEGVNFKNLGLVVIDEQHRFGVLQRAKLVGKAATPDVLIMTATPIPRTLAITVYGDLHVSVIDELPPGRKEIETFYMKDTKQQRQILYSSVEGELKKGRQAYFVYPFIDESENFEFKHIKYALKWADVLQSEIYPEFKVGLLHGRMSSDEKQHAMKKFQNGEYDILVATTVIEVGVDVPNATVMVIENAERFGLSQLHQLRGRIGRGEHHSRCFLVSSFKSGEDSAKRLGIMAETNNGFRISEADLELRGPGDFLGTKQSGLPNFNFANIIRDSKILNEARQAAIEVINDRKGYKDNQALFNYVVNKWGDMLELSSIS